MKVKNIPCKLFTEESQDGLVKCKVIIMNEGKNRNNSSFSKESMEDAEESLKNRPLLAYIKRNEDGEAIDFGSHDIITKIIKTDEGYDLKYFYLETPVGIFPESCNVRYEEIDGENHMVADAYIWEGYSNETLDLLEENEGIKDVSMEISVLESEKDEDGILNINKFRFNGVTLLGSDVIQGMNGNCNISVYSKSDYDDFVNEINNKIYSIEEKEEENLDKNNQTKEFGLSVQNITDQITTQINSRFVEKEDYWGDKYQAREFWFMDVLPDDKIAIVENADWSCRQYFGVPYTLNEDVVTLDFDNKKPYIQEWREMSGEVEPKVFNCEDTQLKEHIINKFDSIDTHENEVTELENLKTSYSELEDKLNAMQDYAELKEFKENYDKAKYEKEIEDASKLFDLDEEEIKDLKDKAMNKEITVAEFKKELGFMFAMKVKDSKPVEKTKTNEVQVFDNVDSKYEPYGGLFKKYL
ncbi:hypothetical protein [Terrisporobacter sp.]|uniref:hypothetical protein n=1 Tax=Terrisporobacter sp. TaxID=1965305 RepID=UPI00262B8586|nr:hypothetical protein [Terrisporobacter sp.]